jgi:Helix-turn-helix domain
VSDIEPEVDPINDKLYSVAELAEMFGRTQWTIRQWVTQGKLKGIKINSRLYFTEDFIREYANGRWGNP